MTANPTFSALKTLPILGATFAIWGFCLALMAA